MEIVLKDGTPRVRFRAGEISAVKETYRICDQLARWLKDDSALEVVENLEDVARTYFDDIVLDEMGLSCEEEENGQEDKGQKDEERDS